MDTPNSLAEHCINQQIFALDYLHKVIKTKEYELARDVIEQAAKSNYTRRVLTAGVGKNANIATKIAETMMSLGIAAGSINVSHLGHGDYGGIGHNDVIIHISRSGTTSEMVEAMRHICDIRPHVTQILVHCNKDKPKNIHANIELFIGAVVEGDEFGLAPTTSTTALLCILDCLSVEVSHNIGFKRMDFLTFHPPGAFGQLLQAEKKGS